MKMSLVDLIKCKFLDLELKFVVKKSLPNSQLTIIVNWQLTMVWSLDETWRGPKLSLNERFTLQIYIVLPIVVLFYFVLRCCHRRKTDRRFFENLCSEKTRWGFWISMLVIHHLEPKSNTKHEWDFSMVKWRASNPLPRYWKMSLQNCNRALSIVATPCDETRQDIKFSKRVGSTEFTIGGSNAPILESSWVVKVSSSLEGKRSIWETRCFHSVFLIASKIKYCKQVRLASIFLNSLSFQAQILVIYCPQLWVLRLQSERQSDTDPISF